MENTEFFDNQTSAVIILDCNKEILYTNNAFKQTFGTIKNLNRFANRFYVDVCLLNPENIQNYSPITNALDSKENTFTQSTYQITKNEYLNFDIQSLHCGEKLIITFSDTTPKYNYAALQKEFTELQKEYTNLENEHNKYAEIQQKAQAQAIKMAILNRVASQLHESVDIDKIINSALKELHTFLGGVKSYYASTQDFKYKIEHTYPNKFSDEVGNIISYDDSVNHSITAREIHIAPCLKEYQESEERFKTNMYRLVVPVFHQTDLLGLLVLLTNQKIDGNQETDVLKAISSQLSNALVQASLFEQINRQNIKLEETLTELKETQLHLINSEKMASLGQLVAGVAHEINTPIASINSNNSITEKLIEKLTANSDEKILSTLKEINNIDKEAIKRISKIVVSLKQFVRLDESELQQANINKELDLTLEIIRHETKNKVEIEKNYGEIGEIKCYPNLLNQVFMNILVNACQSIETRGKIIISTQKEAKKLIIKIKDNGCGIKESDKEKIFLAGYTTKGVGVGTGLGLAISKKIIDKHKGSIDFISEPNKGTEFIITIPYID